MPIWWYHPDHLGSSTYLTDNFGRPSHYYDNMPFGETMVEHNQSQYYNNVYKYNAKELDDATGMYYYGARYYDPRMSIFVSVDPLAEKYPNIGGYVYVANNPVNFIDPDGREIIITAGNESFTYNPNKKYSGNNSFIKKNVEALNKANTVNLGKAVIDEVVSSNSVMNIVEVNNTYENTFEFDIPTMTMKARESTYGGTNDVESVMHEVFHFYQGIYGELDASISTELEAYIFQYALGFQLSGNNSSPTELNEKGNRLNEIFDNFIFDVTDTESLINSFEEGINLFKEGHINGDFYKNFKLNEDKKPNRLLHLESIGVLKYNIKTDE